MRILPGNDLSLGQVAGTSRHLVLPRDGRDKHLYVCGGTGSGKSKLLEHMIRQDILNWRKSHSGFLLLDPHGSLYDALLEWLTHHELDRPIIPIDLRRDDWIVSYNLLRRRASANPSVVVDNFVQAMAHVWGAGGTDATPLFARWASTILRTLYDGSYTLIDALHLIDPQARFVRQAMAAGLSDPAAKRHWREADALSAKDFTTQISSTVNRLERFVRNELMRAVLGQPEVSLDLGQVIEDGAIVLVSLATEGGKVSEEDADTFGSLLLTDIWTAARTRGKRENIKPFYLYLDEFQNFVTPIIAKSLDQARGFGLHVTMAHQFPLQLADKGESGQLLFNSVMENATTKIVFRLSHEDNLKPLAQWLFRGVMDPDKVKHELYSTKVMAYREEERESWTHGRTSTKGGALGATNGRSGASASSSSSGSTSGESYLEPLEPEPPFAPGPRRSLSSSDSESCTDSATDSWSDSSTWSESWSESETDSVTRSTMLIPQIGKELSHVQFRSLEEQLHVAMAALFDQKQRHCVARIADRMKAPVALMTPIVRASRVREEKRQQYLEQQIRKWPFFLPMTEAIKRLAAREAKLASELNEIALAGEPTTARRRLR